MLTEEEMIEMEELSKDEVLCSENYYPFIKEAMESESGDSEGDCGGNYCEVAYRKYRDTNFDGV